MTDPAPGSCRARGPSYAGPTAQALGRLPWFAPFFLRARRLLPRFDMLVISLAGLGGVVIAAALLLRRMRAAKDEGLRFGHRVAMICLVTGLASLVMYAATTETAVPAFTLDSAAAEEMVRPQ